MEDSSVYWNTNFASQSPRLIPVQRQEKPLSIGGYVLQTKKTLFSTTMHNHCSQMEICFVLENTVQLSTKIWLVLLHDFAIAQNPTQKANKYGNYL